MKIGVRTHTGEERRLVLAEQLGAHGGSIWASALDGYDETGVPELDSLLRMRERFERHNLMLTGIGLGAQHLKAQLLGQPERDEEIERVRETLHVIGRAYEDVDAAATPVVIIDQRLTYWARGGWTGTARVKGRGGVLLHDFDASRDAHLQDAPAGEVSYEEAWERVSYLYERIVPVAKEADVRLATHPDDPPLPVYRGAANTLNSFAGFKRLFEAYPSSHNGMLLCLGCMQEADEEVVEVIRYLGERDKIFYVHFRNVRGAVRGPTPHYTEVFPNEGDMDMVAAIRALWEVGYEGVLVPDHQFGIAGDDDWQSISRAWQIGYISALIQATAPVR
jgi:mannonate dehydratase